MNTNQTKGKLIVLSGPSGCGKGTVRELLLKKGGFAFSVSYTTRAPRDIDRPGIDYIFVTRDEFEKRIANGEMLEHTIYNGEYYGTPLHEAMRVIESGKNLLLEIEVEGALNVKKQYADAILIMLLPPSFAEQEKRLRGRATEKEEDIRNRLERTRDEVALIPQYDYLIYNRDGAIEECADTVLKVLNGELCDAIAHPQVPTDYFN